MIFLTVVDNMLHVYWWGSGALHAKVKTMPELLQVIKDLPGRPAAIMASSTVDFAEEYTQDPELLQLCEEINKDRAGLWGIDKATQ